MTQLSHNQPVESRPVDSPAFGSPSAADSPKEPLFLVRLAGDLTTKSRRVRRRFQNRLMENITEALHQADLRCHIRNDWSRLLVSSSSSAAMEPLTRVFGIHSISPVEGTCTPQLEDIIRTGKRLYTDRVRGRKFAIRTKRTGQQSFRSQDVNVQLGAALNPGSTVDLRRPDVPIHVEVRPKITLFYSTETAGPGGLPMGVQDRAVSLLSGGFDSAVSSWMILRRGVEMDYVLCNLAGAANERSVLGVAKILADSWSYGSRPRLHVVDFQELVVALKRDVNQRFVQVLLKRLMYRAANRICHSIGGQAIITGEAIGQVSSQTLVNLRVIEEAADMPVLRPLVAVDKKDIIDYTHHIGTYALSAVVQEYCALTHDRPTTAAKLRVICEEEAKLNLSLLDEAVDNRKIIDIRSLTDDDLVLPYVFTDTVPEQAVVMDCRSETQFDVWHYPGAQQQELDELLTRIDRLDRSKKYVLYCPFGLQSAVLAEKMQAAGYEAYSFRGGSKALRRYAQQQGLED